MPQLYLRKVIHREAHDNHRDQTEFFNITLYLRKEIRPLTHENYRVILTREDGEFEIGSRQSSATIMQVSPSK